MMKLKMKIYKKIKKMKLKMKINKKIIIMK